MCTFSRRSRAEPCCFISASWLKTITSADWLNNRSLLTCISRLSCTESIKPSYCIAPGETRTSLCSASQHTPPSLIPSVTRIIRFPVSWSLCRTALVHTSELHLNSLSSSQIFLLPTERQTCRKQNWHAGRAASKWPRGSRCRAALSALSLCLFLFGSRRSAISTHEASLIMNNNKQMRVSPEHDGKIKLLHATHSYRDTVLIQYVREHTNVCA